VDYICHRRQDYFKSINLLAVAEGFMKNMLYILLLTLSSAIKLSKMRAGFPRDKPFRRSP
jgi:hypothetical protein